MQWTDSWFCNHVSVSGFETLVHPPFIKISKGTAISKFFFQDPNSVGA